MEMQHQRATGLRFQEYFYFTMYYHHGREHRHRLETWLRQNVRDQYGKQFLLNLNRRTIGNLHFRSGALNQGETEMPLTYTRSDCGIKRLCKSIETFSEVQNLLLTTTTTTCFLSGNYPCLTTLWRIKRKKWCRRGVEVDLL